MRQSYAYPSAGTACCHCGQLTSYPDSRQARLAGMGDPATLVESATHPVVTGIPTVIAGEMEGEESLCSGATD